MGRDLPRWYLAAISIPPLNGGANWANRSTATGSGIVGNKNWISIAMSDDGKKLAAVAYTGHLYTATNSGANWTDRSE